MFISDIKWVIPAAIMSSDRLLNADMETPSARLHSENIHKSLLERAIFDFQSYTHTLLRNEDVEYAVSEWLNVQGNVDLIDCLNTLFNHFLKWKGDRLEVKHELLEEWLSFCSLADPTWVIAIGYHNFIRQGVLSVTEVIYIVSNNQCPVALPKATSNTHIADNHIHLGGHGNTALSMLNFAVYLHKRPEINKINWPRRPENTLFESDKLSKNHLPLLMNKLAEYLGKNIFGDSPSANKHQQTWDSLDSYILSGSLLADMKRTSFDTTAQKLLASSHLQQQQSASRWILFCVGILEPIKDNRPDYQRILDCFIRTSNVLRNYMIVSGVGLGQFVEYFGFDHRKPKTTAQDSGLEHKSHGIQYDNSSLTMREFRISPDDIVVNEGEYGFKLKPTSLMNLTNMIHENNLEKNSHFVVHFNRTYPNKDSMFDKHLNMFRNELKQQVEKIQQFASSVTYSDIQLSHAQDCIDLRKLVRGYDVAGNENQLPIEIFSPALRVLRSAKHTTNGIFGKRLPEPFLTIHAGEDFSHIVSGLRAIDESIEFCKFTEGDRIGHGLALGVNVQHWAERQRRAYLTVGEHLDNLVWCHHQALSLIQFNHTFQSVLSLLEHKIRHWSSYLYDGENYTPNDLYQSWMLRRNCPNQLNMALRDDDSQWLDWIPDIEFLKKQPKSVAKKLWDLYLNSGHLDSTSKRNDVLSINCSIDDSVIPSSHAKKLFDSLSKAELDLYQAIQDLLMERYSSKGIILEACPTSNIYIGRFQKYHEHPIFRWNPPNQEWLQDGGKFNRFGIRKGAIPVCINTDDSGLMPTTIDNEHRVIKLAAIKHYNVGTCMAEEWISGIRKKGVDIFQHNHLK